MKYFYSTINFLSKIETDFLLCNKIHISLPFIPGKRSNIFAKMAVRLLKDPATVNSRIFVGHLQTEDMDKHELEEHFQKYGNVVGSLISRGFGFVQFEDEQSALKAIQNEDGTMFKGRRIGDKIFLNA